MSLISIFGPDISIPLMFKVRNWGCFSGAKVLLDRTESRVSGNYGSSFQRYVGKLV